ncbi:MAG: hypothetical protein AAF704_09875 [Cyanobacteria bacterium P01_D01_bin.123]
MKLANPLYYPIPMAIAAALLVLGVRALRLPSLVAIPAAAVVATAGATYRRERLPQSLQIDNPDLARDIQAAQVQARQLVEKSQSLREEASRLLIEADQMELLVAVQYACDRAVELPAQIDLLSRRAQGKDSLLSAENIQRQLTEVRNQFKTSSGAARDQLSQLAESLDRNLQLARQGRDARQAQVVSLSKLLADAAGVLQQLQNELRTADLSDAARVTEMRALSDEFGHIRDNVELLASG